MCRHLVGAWDDPRLAVAPVDEGNDDETSRLLHEDGRLGMGMVPVTGLVV